MDLGVDANNNGTGTWMQLTPALAVGVMPHITVSFSLPLYYLNAASSIDAAKASRGVGDAVARFTLDANLDTNSFYATLTAGAPTGSAANGLGAGKATCDLSAFAQLQLGRMSPYVTGGLSNNAGIASESQTAGSGAGRLAPGIASGNLGHAEAGIEVDLGRSTYATASVYGVFASASSVTTTTVVGGVRRGPRGRPVRAGATTTPITGTIDDQSDHGVGAVLWTQLNEAVDVGLWVSHSLLYKNFNTISISANVNVAQFGRKARAHQ